MTKWRGGFFGLGLLTLLLLAVPRQGSSREDEPDTPNEQLRKPDLDQIAALKRTAEYLWGPDDLVTLELKRLGYEPPPNSALAGEWSQLSVEDKLLVATEDARSVGGKNHEHFLAALSASLARKYDSVASGSEPVLRKYLNLAASDEVRSYLARPDNLRWPKEEDRLRERPAHFPKLPPELKSVLRTIAQIAEGSTLGSKHSVLQRYFMLSSKDALELLKEKIPPHELMAKALVRNEPHLWDVILSKLLAHLTEAVPAAKDQPEFRGFVNIESREGYRNVTDPLYDLAYVQVLLGELKDELETKQWDAVRLTADRLGKAVSSTPLGFGNEINEMVQAARHQADLLALMNRLGPTLDFRTTEQKNVLTGRDSARLSELLAGTTAGRRLDWLRDWATLELAGHNVDPVTERNCLARLARSSAPELLPLIRTAQADASVRAFLRRDLEMAKANLPNALPASEVERYLADIRAMMRAEGNLASELASQEAKAGPPAGIKVLLPSKVAEGWQANVKSAPEKAPVNWVRSEEVLKHTEKELIEVRNYLASDMAREAIDRARLKTAGQADLLSERVRQQSESLQAKLAEVSEKTKSLSVSDRQSALKQLAEGQSADSVANTVQQERRDRETHLRELAQKQQQDQDKLAADRKKLDAESADRKIKQEKVIRQNEIIRPKPVLRGK